MKNSLFIFFVILTIAACKPARDAVRRVDRAHRAAPPGTVWLYDSITDDKLVAALYIDQAEVRNVDYLEFVMWTKKNDSANYLRILPDTMVWAAALSYNEPYAEYYFRHPAYRNYPVVGVSYEQAVAFCKWRTERVRDFDTLNKKARFPKGLEYRLPTQEEWENAALGSCEKCGELVPESMIDYGFVSMQGRHGYPNFNVRETAALGYTMLSSDVTSTVYPYRPNSFGLYNMIGNVAEMVSAKGISKGGGWIHSIEKCRIRDSISYDGPKAWLGFRCVCVVKK